MNILRGFAAVAEIRQADDVGIDAIGTLLHPEAGLLYAGRSFALQFKSWSVSSFQYSDHALRWFVKQRLPLFICRVDLNGGLMAMYTTSPGRRIIMHEEVQTLHFDFREPNGIDRATVDDDELRVSLGPPICNIHEREARTDAITDSVSSLLDAWLQYEYRNVELARIGRYVEPRWRLGEPPERFGYYSSGSYQDLVSHMEAAEPYIDKLAQHIFFSESSKRFEEALAFLLLARWFRAEGIETDFDDQLGWRVSWPDWSDVVGDANAPGTSASP